jgi:hypothetical protein
MRFILALALAALVAAPALAGEHSGDSDKVLTGSLKTEHLDIRFRPGSRAGASAERTGAVAERDLARICEQLQVKNDGRYSLFLFDDIPEIWAVTKVTGNAGYSSGDTSYIPFENDQTRFHEMVHIVAFAKVGAGKTMFLAEGLANALLEFVHGVPVHAVAKYYRKAGALPPLAEMTGAADSYAWMRAHPALNAYDVAASWMKFLIDTHGIAKVKQYYVGKPAKTVFGADEAALEKAWLAALDKFELRPEVEALLKVRDGKGETGVTPETFAAKDGWEPLVPGGTSRAWTIKDGVVTGASDSWRWSVCEYEPAKLARDCAVVAKVRFAGAGGVQLRIGAGNQAMLLPNGLFVFDDERCVASMPEVKLPEGGGAFEFALVRRRGVLEVWLDGTKVLSTEARTGEARAGIGLVAGTATFESVKLRTFD